MIIDPTLLAYLRDPVEARVRRERAESTLLKFVKQAWHVLESTPLDISRHIECLCEHLEAVANQQCLRLLINLPPQHMKSILAYVFFPGWVWANRTRRDASGAPTNLEGGLDQG